MVISRRGPLRGEVKNDFTQKLNILTVASVRQNAEVTLMFKGLPHLLPVPLDELLRLREPSSVLRNGFYGKFGVYFV